MLRKLRQSRRNTKRTNSRSSFLILWNTIWLMLWRCSDGDRGTSEPLLLLHTSRQDFSEGGEKEKNENKNNITWKKWQIYQVENAPTRRVQLTEKLEKSTCESEMEGETCWNPAFPHTDLSLKFIYWYLKRELGYIWATLVVSLCSIPGWKTSSLVLNDSSISSYNSLNKTVVNVTLGLDEQLTCVGQLRAEWHDSSC